MRTTKINPEYFYSIATQLEENFIITTKERNISRIFEILKCFTFYKWNDKEGTEQPILHSFNWSETF